MISYSMLDWIRLLPLVVVLILLIGPFALRLFNFTAHAMGHHSSSCGRKAEASLCNATHSIPDELDDEKEPSGSVIIKPLTGTLTAKGQLVATLFPPLASP